MGIFQARNNLSALTISGNAMLSTNGVVYAPAAALILSGNSNLSAPLVVDTLALSGNADPSPILPGRPGAFVDGVPGEAVSALVKSLGSDLAFSGFGKASLQSVFEGDLVRVGSASQDRGLDALEYVFAEFNTPERRRPFRCRRRCHAGRHAKQRRVLRGLGGCSWQPGAH